MAQTRWIPASAGMTLLMAALVSAKGPSEGRRPSFVEQSERFVYRSLEDDRGGFYVVWTHELKGAFHLVAQHVDERGAARWEMPGRILAEGLNDPEQWAAFADSVGGLVVAWTAPEGLRAQRRAPDGGPLWGKTGSVLLSTRTCSFPTGMADATGGAYLVWSEKRYADRAVLSAQHLGAAGDPAWGTEGLRVSLRPSDQSRPRAVYDGQAGVIVVWKDFRENASQIQAQRLDYQGNRLWGAEGLVVTAPAGNAKEFPLVEPLGDGGAVVAWAGPSSGASRIFIQTIDGRGRFRGEAGGAPLSVGDWDQWNPVLYGDGKGNIWAGWDDYRNHAHWQAFAAVVSARAAVTRASGELPLAPGSSDQGHVALSDDGRGGIFAAWLDNRTGDAGLYVQEVSAQARVLMGEDGHGVAAHLTNPSTPQIVGLGPGRAVVLVADREKKTRWALYWTAVNGPEGLSAGQPGRTPETFGVPEPAGEGMATP